MWLTGPPYGAHTSREPPVGVGGPRDNRGMWWQEVATPMGGLGIAVDEGGLCRVDFRGSPAAPSTDARLDKAAEQLRGYFAGELTSFDLPLSVTEGSPFERAVWEAIAAIPYAQMRTYGEI